ncbi:MAG: hypothetical protein WB586_28070 [Chthoniobacterales bacterium]
MTRDSELHGSIYYKARLRHFQMSASQFPLLAFEKDLLHLGIKEAPEYEFPMVPAELRL